MAERARAVNGNCYSLQKQQESIARPLASAAEEVSQRSKKGQDVNLACGNSAGQAGAVEGEVVEGAEDGDGDLGSLEVLLGERLEFFARDGFDPGEDLIERVEAAEIQLLAREIGHAGAGGLEGKHQRAFEMIFCAT